MYIFIVTFIILFYFVSSTCFLIPWIDYVWQHYGEPLDCDLVHIFGNPTGMLSTFCHVYLLFIMYMYL